MSCRVIGRNVEFVFMDYIIKHLLNSGIKQLNAKYVATVNNRQVENFYEKFGFIQVSSDTKHKTYELDLHKYKWSGTDYVEVENGR
jgi:predicted enzyme involved in methoxymalonyl-ACP biosynthesis